jgi:acetyl esterase/lipase
MRASPLFCLISFVSFFATWTATAFCAEPAVIPLWSQGAPGFEARRNEPEEAKDYWVRNIHNPSLTVFPAPKEKANGTAVVICPGGGHALLVYNSEGVEAARFFNSIGVTAFVLKYRVARQDGSPYAVETHSAQDGRRAVRLVRSRAAEFGVHPNRVGMVGFSAGGEVVAMTTWAAEPAIASPDAVDQQSSHPDFNIFIYPGPIGFPKKIEASAPPSFFVAAYDDLQPAQTITELLPLFRAAGVRVEVHLFANGAHAFNMGFRSEYLSLRGWPQRAADWLLDSGLLKAPTP